MTSNPLRGVYSGGGTGRWPLETIHLEYRRGAANPKISIEIRQLSGKGDANQGVGAGHLLKSKALPRALTRLCTLLYEVITFLKFEKV